MHKKIIFGAPQFYVQGPNILVDTGQHIKELELDGKALILVDSGVQEIVTPIFESMRQNSIEYDELVYRDQITLDRIAKLCEDVKDKGYGMVIGVGGGKAIDVAKRVGWALKIPMIAVPTSIATDAATSRTAVAYGINNEIVEDKTLYNPVAVLVDSAVVVKAPVRLFRSGMADAISKRYEYHMSLKYGSPNWYDAGSAFFIEGISQEMHEFLLRNGRYLLECFEKGELNETVEHGITAMLLMSRLVWDSGGLRGAHDMFEEFHDMGYGDNSLHGEIVGYFDLVQLLMEKYSDNEFEELYALYKELQIPLKISQMGFPVENKDALRELSIHLTEKCGKFGYNPGEEKFTEAIRILEQK